MIVHADYELYIVSNTVGLLQLIIYNVLDLEGIRLKLILWARRCGSSSDNWILISAEKYFIWYLDDRMSLISNLSKK